MFDSIPDTPALSYNMTSDQYAGVLFEFPTETMRIVISGSNPQWVVQRREQGHRSRSRWPWKTLAQSTTREGLTRVLRGRFKATRGLREFVESLPEFIPPHTT